MTISLRKSHAWMEKKEPRHTATKNLSYLSFWGGRAWRRIRWDCPLRRSRSRCGSGWHILPASVSILIPSIEKPRCQIYRSSFHLFFSGFYVNYTPSYTPPPPKLPPPNQSPPTLYTPVSPYMHWAIYLNFLGSSWEEQLSTCSLLYLSSGRATPVLSPFA